MADKICEKCIHYEMCKAEMDLALDDTFSFFPYNEDCPHFKNKADFVEVVRCKDCNYYKPYTKPVEDFDGECVIRECEANENEFCSYGTPKERGGEK